MKINFETKNSSVRMRRNGMIISNVLFERCSVYQTAGYENLVSAKTLMEDYTNNPTSFEIEYGPDFKMDLELFLNCGKYFVVNPSGNSKLGANSFLSALDAAISEIKLCP